MFAAVLLNIYGRYNLSVEKIWILHMALSSDASPPGKAQTRCLAHAHMMIKI